MEIPEIYAIAVGGVLLILTLINFRSYIVRGWKAAAQKAHKLTYPQLLRRHRFVGPWNPVGVFLHLFYIGVNVGFVAFDWPHISIMGPRAANLSLINLIPLLAGPHLSLPADILGISWRTYRQLHRSAGWISFALLCFHVLTVIAKGAPFPLRISENQFGLIGLSSVCCLVVFSHPFFRRLSYEIFIRAHQALAILAVYSSWRHLVSKPSLSRLYIYIAVGTFVLTMLIQCVIITFRTGAIGRGWPRASITNVREALKRENEFIDQDVLTIRVKLVSPLKVRAGQYICLWLRLPDMTFRSIMQSHPFTITSWSDKSLDSLDLFVEPREGLTKKLLRYAGSDPNGDPSYLALFSGPHGTSVPAGDYETVLLIADGFGIAPHLSYLKQLIHEYNACKIRTRRIHLVWQIETEDLVRAARGLLNDALDGDTLLSEDIEDVDGKKMENKADGNKEKPSKGKILSISIYAQWGRQRYFGKRAVIYPGLADLEAIFQEEASGRYIKRVQEESNKRGEMLVMVSGSDVLRDRLRKIVRDHPDNNDVRLEELEYQPCD